MLVLSITFAALTVYHQCKYQDGVKSSSDEQNRKKNEYKKTQDTEERNVCIRGILRGVLVNLYTRLGPFLLLLDRSCFARQSSLSFWFSPSCVIEVLSELLVIIWIEGSVHLKVFLKAKESCSFLPPSFRPLRRDVRSFELELFAYNIRL